MTFVLSLGSRDTVWLIADRRISWPHEHKDHGIKVMTLKCSDGVAILGYAGLGQTPGGTQPSTWMSNVLRGFDMTVHEALWKLDYEIERDLHDHIVGSWNHLVLVPAFVDGESRVYGIGLSKDGQIAHRALRIKDPPYPAHLAPAPPRVMYIGSGGEWLAKQQARQRLVREMCSLAKKHDQERISDRAVADGLAALNLLVSQNVPTVSPDCLVVWLRRPGSKLPIFEMQSYEGKNRAGAIAYPFVATDPAGPALGDWIFDQTHTFKRAGDDQA